MDVAHKKHKADASELGGDGRANASGAAPALMTQSETPFSVTEPAAAAAGDAAGLKRKAPDWAVSCSCGGAECLNMCARHQRARARATTRTAPARHYTHRARARAYT